MSWIELVAQGHPQQVPKGVTPPDNALDWYRIENAADTPDETDVYVYDAIGGWFGTTADNFMRDLKAIGTPRINLRLNSPGGSVFEGITIANAIRTHPANVTVYVDGLAASIASVIALAGDRLVMMPLSQMMIHDASGGCYGNAADMAYMMGLLDKQSDNIADAYADRAGGTAAEWRDLMKAETWYTAKEAVTAGLADEVMPVPVREPDEEDEPTSAAPRMSTAWDLTAYRYAGREKAPAPGQPQAAVDGIVPAPMTSTENLTPVVVNLSVTSGQIRDLILAPLREELRALAASPPKPEDAKPPFLEPDEDEETEDAADPEAEPEAAADPDEVDDADTEEVDDAKTKKKLPPWLKPDEDEDEDDEKNAVAPPEEPPETQDAWSKVMAGLIKSPSPSADDVLNRLKEAS